MTMTLIANNKDYDYQPDYPIGFWEFLMFEVGCGEAIGLRRHEENKNQFYYEPDKNNNCPMHNDGFIVKSGQAKQMAKIAFKNLNKFESFRDPQLQRFIDFCNGSNGFEVH